MGRGSSKAGGGSGGGVAIKDIENQALKTVMQDITRRIMTNGRYTHAQSIKDGKIIDNNTNPGDVFKHNDVSYRKQANGLWTDGSMNTDIEPDGMARIIAGLTQFNGTWRYKKAR